MTLAMSKRRHRFFSSCGAAILIAVVVLSPAMASATSNTFTNIASGHYLGVLPSINDSGIVAFSRHIFSPGIFTGSGGPITTIADDSGPFSGDFSTPDINSSGTVAFKANLDSSGQGIFTGSGGQITTIADSSGPFSDFNAFSGPRPSINDSGTVAFFATL